ncbi:MAG: alkaline phosphatase [Nitrospirae bacterium]|nr:alkaline phosphatase [Nitrospirota bacterium]
MKKHFQTMVCVISIVILLALALPGISCAGTEVIKSSNYAKNIIFMVPDGMGLYNVTAARIFKNGPDGNPLYLETLPQIGYQRTHSRNSTVTDSAAAAAAWACGEKFNNNEISCHDNDGDKVCDTNGSPATILELAKQSGKATGLVATSTISHATPAVWAAHVHYRNCETEIARQYIEVTGVDVILGGGIGSNQAGKNCEQYLGQDKNAVISSAISRGYEYVINKSEMEAAVAARKNKILGLFTASGKTPETYRIDPIVYSWNEEEPTLPEMTAAALDILEEDKDGFFLMVEGSQIDWANHDNDITYQIGETLAFDESVGVVLDWINAEPSRKNHTLVIIVADHDCGGFAVNGPYGSLSNAGDIVEAGWTSGDHTAGDTIIWSQGPGSHYLGKALDNTDLFSIMKKVLR